MMALEHLDPFRDDAEEGVDYDEITETRTISGETPTRIVIAHLGALLVGHGAIPDYSSFDIEVEVIEEVSLVASPVREIGHLSASMTGRRPR